MILKHQLPDISASNPFEHCKLNREKYAEVLTQIVETYADGFVLAINNEWGAGKTTFVKMWEQYLKSKQFRTIYFNAWENDYDDNPLVALLAELRTVNNKSDKVGFKKLLKGAAVLGRNVLPTIAQSIADKYIDTKVIGEAIKDVTRSSMELFESEVDEYINKRNELIQFRKVLTEYVQGDVNSDSLNDILPVVFIIDELDRCRPDYAVEILEKLKHFFSVPGIVFVLSIDKEHLGSSIKGFYGSENINTDEYLRRFIDLEYSIPRPSYYDYCKYLYEYYRIKDLLQRREYSDKELEETEYRTIITGSLFFEKSRSTLRQLEKIYSVLRLTICTFKPREEVIPHLTFFLICLKLTKPKIYQQIQNLDFTLDQIGQQFYELMILDRSTNHWGEEPVYIQAILIHLYSNSKTSYSIKKLYQSIPYDKYDTHVNCLPANSMGLANYLRKADERYQGMNLHYLLDKINSLESLMH